jgi:hypothetical protein
MKMTSQLNHDEYGHVEIARRVVPQTFMGFPVYINDAVCAAQPRMQCSAEFVKIQDPKLVEETNAWMREFFGCEDDRMYMVTDPVYGKKIFTSTNLFRKMKEAENATKPFI